MGRGRAKAKQIKVARKLKYSAPETDLSALERELHGSGGDLIRPAPVEEEPDEDEDDDPYSAYVADDEGEDDDYGSWTAGDGR